TAVCGRRRALVPRVRDGDALQQRERRQAVRATLRRGVVVAQRARVVAELGARLAGLQLERRRLAIVGPLGQHRLVQLARLAMVVLVAGLARVAVVLAGERRPRGARELGAGGARRVRRLRLIPRAAGGELWREFEPRAALFAGAVPALVRLDHALDADQRVGFERVALDQQAVRVRSLGVETVAAEVLAHRPQQPRALRPGS